MTIVVHPTEPQLTLGDPVSSAHAAGCPRCARIAAGPDRSLPAVDVRSATVSSVVLALVQRRTSVDRPARGDVWRAEWDGAAAVVVCFAGEGQTVDVLPADLVDPQPDDAGWVPADATLLGCAFSVAVAEPVRVPRFVLDRRLDRIPLPDTAGPDVRDTWGVGRARVRLRAMADDAFEQSSRDQAAAGTLAGLLRDHGVTRADLMAAGLPARMASLILQGRADPTGDQLDAIAALVDVPAADLAGRTGGFPGRLLAVLHEPVNRPRVEERARTERRPVPVVRRDVGLAIAGAGRRTVPGTTIDWQAEVDAFFDS